MIDWDSVLPDEKEILSVLPEEQKEAAFEEAEKCGNHCQNLYEWLNHLRQYVKGWSLTHGK